jgi:predicted DNA-binding protein (MmcQ/YjbR family)
LNDTTRESEWCAFAEQSIVEVFPVRSSTIMRLRKLCLALPEAHEVEAWGEPTFRVRNKIFAMYASANNHHGKGRDATWLKAAPGDQEKMVAAAPECFFVPPYVGPSGWIGIWLDGVVEWEDVADFLRDSYRLVAPRKLCALLDSALPGKPAAPKNPPPKKRRSNRA